MERDDKSTLVIRRKMGESVWIGESVKITVSEARQGSSVKLIIQGPRYVKVLRDEVRKRDQENGL